MTREDYCGSLSTCHEIPVGQDLLSDRYHVLSTFSSEQLGLKKYTIGKTYLVSKISTSAINLALRNTGVTVSRRNGRSAQFFFCGI